VTIIMKWTLALTFVATVGCASSAAEQEAVSQQPESKKPKIEAPDDADSADARDATKDRQADGEAVTCRTNAAAGDLRDLAIGMGGSNRSLCDTLLSSDHKAMVLYITSPTCVSCKETLAALSSELSGSDEVELVVAVPTSLDEFVDSYSESEIASFVATLAPAAKSATDPAGKTWLSLSKDPTVPVFPVVIAFNRGGKGYVLDSDSIDSVSRISANLFPKIDFLTK
jgi:hypothetical protein